MPGFNPDNVKKVLVIRWGGLGDLALCSAVIEDLTQAMPHADFHLHTEKPWQQLFAHDPRFEQVFDYPLRKKGRLEGLRWWLKLLAEERYDLVVDLQCNDRSWLLLAAAKLLGRAPKWLVSRKSGFPYSFRNEPHSTDVPAIQLLRMPLQLMGLSPEADKPILHSGEEDRKAVELMLKPLNGQRFAILVPGCSAAGAHKRWGSHRYAELGELLLASGEVEKIVILGAGDEADVCQQVAYELADGALNLCGKTALTHIVPLAENADLIVSNDTGVAHIAAAAGRPMIVVCGPTLAIRVKPLGEHVKAIQIDPECFKQQSADQCMAKLSPEEVLDAIRQLKNQLPAICR